MIRILGVDVGSVRVGVALCDPLGITAQPLLVIERKREDVFARLAALAREHEVTELVVGYPLRLSGEHGPATEAVDAFIAELAKHLTLKVTRWDERLTTAAAERSMKEGGARRAKRRANIDKVAAALILQSYLDSRRHET